MAKEKDLKIEHSYFNKFQFMAIRQYKKALMFKDDIQKIRNKGVNITDEDAFAIAKMNAEIEICGVQVIIFCTLALESFINHYASRRLSKAYLDKYLDQLDHATKWIVIPRIATGKQLNPGSTAVKNLHALIVTRDRLLQCKVKQKFTDRFSCVDYSWIEDAEFAIATVADLVAELARIDDCVKPGWATKPNPSA